MRFASVNVIVLVVSFIAKLLPCCTKLCFERFSGKFTSARSLGLPTVRQWQHCLKDATSLAALRSSIQLRIVFSTAVLDAAHPPGAFYAFPALHLSKCIANILSNGTFEFRSRGPEAAARARKFCIVPTTGAGWQTVPGDALVDTANTPA